MSLSQNAPKSKGIKREELKKQYEDVEDEEEIGSDDDLTRGKRRKTEKEKQKLEESELVEMKKLENLIFGSLYSPVTFGKEEEEDGSALFHVDRSAVRQIPDYEDDGDDDEELSDEENGQVVAIRKGEAAWEDEEEKQINVDIASVNRLRKLRKEENEGLISGSEYIARLRAHHAKLNPGTDWARPDSQIVDGESSDDDDTQDGGVDDILRTNEDLVVKSRGNKLCAGRLEYSKLVDANAADPSNGPINSVHFHQNAQLLLTAGLDRRLRFFQIDGKRNTKIQSIFLEDCPIRKAAFLPNGSQVIVSGRRKFFYSFDLEKAKFDKIGPLVGREEKSLEYFEVSQDSNTIAFVGNEGYILLVSTKTKELIGTLKMNGSVRSLAFSEDGKHLLSSGGDGQVYVWDLRTMKCLYKGVDEGSTCGTSLCSSLNGALFASGTDRGIVNIYKKSEFVGGKRKPIKTVDNLTSKIDFMKFNHDAQILAIVSTMNKNSVKLVHVPSLTVFSNWPPPNSTMHYPRCLDFSPGSGFMAMGNAAGKVLLYKLHHYQNA
ncbi:U3 small nucleolar RNA-associated protein 18 [Arabidopsis thaliana]|jgi:U3 small nucleolar RNA-associated protein 18|uniref:U3 small nucleolar RNA-associated protein 18 homolog n=3 Tax=Arabidopsis TaxID=3701 RepID=UTP18_ARATH|nr:Transducin/WD40 repeat-like superfamily protein [Arabidopsis thaliana]Q9FMU5.1 RecName: Full=U3 small nucleolar RNA-associated protein 18 homolog [Arabidopsis thaliana]KAG7559419.1 WD40 repeat [Arabidopsis thaliana x Arabidopsis arenosa]AAL77685.1 AT5g14050/MUA22_5 [Arabidopsis thaliana]AAM91464.1 AT5g14050/MUA22_5 [Arabidopsis thaliana]AED91981.1 Transducin/WD40 repeat-like superfamily protein [Arabidopsis thaliana]KAG7602191.1 WD40 repeat [Arabidopsis thaliana x Arabidopsis arenosa]|eukprot:NP_196909.1 Transducin/WD40 repeat-like superfamily protein [Arabidopsis thaliana]